jgi:hypothetical protein
MDIRFPLHKYLFVCCNTCIIKGSGEGGYDKKSREILDFKDA